MDLGFPELLNSGTIDFQGDGGRITGAANSPGGLNNTGTIVKSTGTGTAIVACAVSEAGHLDAESGTLSFGATSGSLAGATFTVVAGAEIDATGPMSGTFTGSGAGIVRLRGIYNQPTGSTSATLNFPPGMLHWEGADEPIFVTNIGFMTVDGGLTFYNFSNRGTMIITNTATPLTALSIQNSGLIDFQGDASLLPYSQNGGNAGLLVNSGTIRKSAGTGTSTVGCWFSDQGGTIDSESGTIDFHVSPLFVGFGDALQGTTFTAAAGAEIDFDAMPQAPVCSGTLSGSGGGTVRFDDGMQSGSSPAVFNFASGMLHWTGGTYGGPQTISNAGSLAIDGAISIAAGTVSNAGTMDVTPAGSINDNGTLANLAGGVIDLQGDGSITSSGSLANAGTLRKSAGTGVSTVSCSFIDTNGAIDAETGTISFSHSNPTSFQGTTLTVAAGAEIDFANGYTQTSAGSLNIQVAGAVAANSANWASAAALVSAAPCPSISARLSRPSARSSRSSTTRARTPLRARSPGCRKERCSPSAGKRLSSPTTAGTGTTWC